MHHIYDPLPLGLLLMHQFWRSENAKHQTQYTYHNNFKDT